MEEYVIYSVDTVDNDVEMDVVGFKDVEEMKQYVVENFGEYDVNGTHVDELLDEYGFIIEGDVWFVRCKKFSD